MCYVNQLQPGLGTAIEVHCQTAGARDVCNNVAMTCNGDNIGGVANYVLSWHPLLVIHKSLTIFITGKYCRCIVSLGYMTIDPLHRSPPLVYV